MPSMAEDLAVAASVAELHAEGIVVLDDVLPSELCTELCELADRRWQGRPSWATYLHEFDFINLEPKFLALIDVPLVLRVVTELIGTNIYVYHSHLDVTEGGADVESSYSWHQDAGDMLDDLGGSSAPLISVKVAFFLSAIVSERHGATRFVARSHLLDTPVHREKDRPVDGERSLLARAGSCAVFDCRLWHSRGPHLDGGRRRVAFVAYAPLWVRPRDRLSPPPSVDSKSSGIRRQLRGEGSDAMSFHRRSAFARPLDIYRS